jgi:hypothetical protein
MWSSSTTATCFVLPSGLRKRELWTKSGGRKGFIQQTDDEAGDLERVRERERERQRETERERGREGEREGERKGRERERGELTSAALPS